MREIFIIKWIYFLKKKNENLLVFIKILYLYYYLTFSSVKKKLVVKKKVKKQNWGWENRYSLFLCLGFPFGFWYQTEKLPNNFSIFKALPFSFPFPSHTHKRIYTPLTSLHPLFLYLFLFLSLKRLTFSVSLFLCITKFEERGLVFVFFLIIKIIFKR